MEKQILIVDDEESVAFFLAESLAELGSDYRVTTANSGEEALAKMAARSFDVLVTDLRMPGINGLELIEQARTRSSHTRLILMTAYGNARVEGTAYRLGACRYLSKPFQIHDLVTAVQSAVAEVQVPGRDILVLSDERFGAISRCLADLRFEVSAQCILLADIAGQMLAYVGTTEGLDLQVLISLISGSFATAFEMARYLKEEEALTLNYHEGKHLDVYSANVNEDLFLVLIFRKRHQSSRIGMVWLYTRRALEQIRTLVVGAERMSAGEILGDDFGVLLSDSFDQLLLNPAAPVGEGRRPAEGVSGPTLEEATLALAAEPEAPEPTPDCEEVPPPPASATFDLEQALRMGLLDPSWDDQAGDEE